MKFVSSNSNFKQLDENDTFLLGHLFEMIYLINKKRKKQFCLGGFYGDPSCGIISSNSKWCIVGGSLIVVWKETGSITIIDERPLNWVHDLRETGPFEAEMLIDPWADQAAIWHLNIDTLDRHKLKQLEPLTDGNHDDVEW